MANTLPNEGTSLSIKLSGSTFTVIPQVTSIDAPNPTRTIIPTTHLGTVGHHTKRASRLADSGQLTFTILYDPNDTTHQALFTKFDDADPVDFKLVLVDDMVVPANEMFTALISQVEGGGIEIETNQERTFTLDLTGAITRTAGAAS